MREYFRQNPIGIKQKTGSLKLECAVVLMSVIGMLTGCSDAGTVSASPAVAIAPELLEYRDITWQQFERQTEQEAEFYHATYYCARIPATEVSIIFAGEYDTDLAGAVLKEDSKCLRLEGTLSSLMTGIAQAMEPEEFAGDISWTEDAVPDYQLAEGAGTAYYVSDRYLVINFDSDGDGTEDAVLEISMDQSESVGPDSYAWLHWNDGN